MVTETTWAFSYQRRTTVLLTSVCSTRLFIWRPLQIRPGWVPQKWPKAPLRTVNWRFYRPDALPVTQSTSVKTVKHSLIEYSQAALSSHHSNINIHSLSSLTVIFPDGPGLASMRVSPFWILLELRMLEMVATTGALRRAYLQSNHDHQQCNTQVLKTVALPIAQRL